MNGTGPEIEVVRPFNEAVEMTKQILFRPFDLKKWLVIGFAAWLAHIGGGFNFNYRYNRQTDLRNVPALDGLRHAIHHSPSWVVVVGIACLIVVILCLVILFAWLRARGSFMFTDCVVRNRAAIAEPWREFRKIANSFFLFSLVVTLGFLVVAAISCTPIIVALVRGRHGHHSPGALLVVAIVVLAAVIFVLAMAWALVANLMIPIMYRRRCLASEGFRAASSLISSYPGEITIYCLFWIVLGIGTAVVACLTVCLTCCIAAIPYVGTVILLPVYVCLRAFGLLFLRQFGSDYDVWAGLPQPTVSPPPEPPPLPA